MKTVKFLIQKSSDTEMTILCQDGGLAFIEHNEICFVSTYHSMRLPKISNSEIFENLIETDYKQQLSDWSIKRDEIGLDMILDAVHWLYCSTNEYVPELTYCENSNIDMFEWLETNYAE